LDGVDVWRIEFNALPRSPISRIEQFTDRCDPDGITLSANRASSAMADGAWLRAQFLNFG